MSGYQGQRQASVAVFLNRHNLYFNNFFKTLMVAFKKKMADDSLKAAA